MGKNIGKSKIEEKPKLRNVKLGKHKNEGNTKMRETQKLRNAKIGKHKNRETKK